MPFFWREEMSKNIEVVLSTDYKNRFNREGKKSLPSPETPVTHGMQRYAPFVAYTSFGFSTIAHATVKVMLRAKRGYTELPNCFSAKRSRA